MCVGDVQPAVIAQDFALEPAFDVLWHLSPSESALHKLLNGLTRYSMLSASRTRLRQPWSDIICAAAP